MKTIRQTSLAGTMRRSRGLGLIVAAFVLLATAWNFIVPPYEAPDEPAHVQFAQFIAQNHRLPDLRSELTEAGIESPQAPLYYLLSGAALAWARNPELHPHPPVNSKYTMPAAETGANRFLPSREPEWGVHLIRAVSTLLGVETVLVAFALAFALTEQEDVALVAASMTAFLPQFAFLAGAANNDNLAAALGAASIFGIVRVSQIVDPRNRDYLLLGLVLGLSLLTKSSLFVLLPIAALALAARKGQSMNALLKRGAVVAAGTIIACGWYFARNVFMYGDLVYVQAWSDRLSEQVPLRGAGWQYFVNAFPQLFFRSYFGVFGWLNIFLPTPLYAAFMVGVLVSAGGLWKMVWDRRFPAPRLWSIVILFVGLTMISVLVWNLTYIAPQGRLLFGAISAVSALLALGWAAYPSRVRRALFIAAPAFFLLANLFSIWFVAATFGAVVGSR